MPAFSKIALPALRSAAARSARPQLAAQSRFFASVDPVVEKARIMKDTPFDAAKEPGVTCPEYVGWDKEIQDDFIRLQTGKKTANGAGRPYLDICESALDLIGFTPMVRMTRLQKHLELECELVAKCEFFNAGGSVKDRIGKNMVEMAEKEGRIKPGDVLIEPTSGNTGIGLCLTAALKGYKMIICLPQKMSGEKVNTMKCLGAEILRTPTEAAWNALDSHIFLSQRLAKELNGHVLDQYKNPANPLAHYEGTAEEIFEQTGGKLDYMVMSAGTGGTVTGTGLKLKELMPNCKIVAVDPHGSILAVPDSMNDGSARTGQGRLQGYHVEGIGYDFVPTVLDQGVVDHWVKTDDDESFAMGRNVVRHEGLLIGGSCGATMAGAYKFIKENNIGAGKTVGVLFADSSRNYMSKFMDDDWLAKEGFKVDEVYRTTLEKGHFEKLYSTTGGAAKEEKGFFAKMFGW